MQWVLESEPWKSVGVDTLRISRIATTSRVGGAAEVKLTIHGDFVAPLLPGTEVTLKALSDEGHEARMLIGQDGDTTVQQTFWTTGVEADGRTIRTSVIEPVPAYEGIACVEIYQRQDDESAWDLLRRASAETLTPEIDPDDLDPEWLAEAVPKGWCMAIANGTRPEERIAMIVRSLRSWGYRVESAVRAASSLRYRLLGTEFGTEESGMASPPAVVLRDDSWGPAPDAPEGVIRLMTDRITEDVHEYVKRVLSPRAKSIFGEGGEDEEDPVVATPTRIRISGHEWRATRASIEVELFDPTGVPDDENRSGKLTATIDLSDEAIRWTDLPAPSFTLTGVIVNERDVDGWLLVKPRSNAESKSPDPAFDYLDRWKSTAEDGLLLAKETAPGGGRGEDRMMRAEWREGDEVVIGLPGNGIPFVMGGIGEAMVGEDKRVVRLRVGELWLHAGDETKTTWNGEGVQVTGNTRIDGDLDTS